MGQREEKFSDDPDALPAWTTLQLFVDGKISEEACAECSSWNELFRRVNTITTIFLEAHTDSSDAVKKSGLFAEPFLLECGRWLVFNAKLIREVAEGVDEGMKRHDGNQARIEFLILCGFCTVMWALGENEVLHFPGHKANTIPHLAQWGYNLRCLRQGISNTPYGYSGLVDEKRKIAAGKLAKEWGDRIEDDRLKWLSREIEEFPSDAAYAEVLGKVTGGIVTEKNVSKARGELHKKLNRLIGARRNLAILMWKEDASLSRWLAALQAPVGDYAYLSPEDAVLFAKSHIPGEHSDYFTTAYQKEIFGGGVQGKRAVIKPAP